MNTQLFTIPEAIVILLTILTPGLFLATSGLRRRGFILRLPGRHAAILCAVAIVAPALMVGCPIEVDRQLPQATPLPAAAVSVPVYPGAKLVSEVENGRDDVRRIYTTDAEIDEIIRFYRKEAPKYGWDGGSEMVRSGTPEPDYTIYLDFAVYDPRSIDIYYLYVRLTRHDNQTEIGTSVSRRYKG